MLSRIAGTPVSPGWTPIRATFEAERTGASARAADACPQDGPQSPANTTFLFFLQGSDFFAKEAARLERMLASGKVGPGKLVEIGKKLSVLGAFTEDEPAAAAA